MRLSDQEINEILQSKGLVCFNLDEYQNLDTILQLECEHGHKIEASLRTIRNPKFKCIICEGKDSLSTNISVVNVPKKQGYRIVAIDNATEHVGLSVYDDGNLVFWHKYNYVGQTIERIAKNRQFLEQTIIKEWEPDFIVLEDIQYQQNINTFKVLAMLLGSSLVSAFLGNIKTETVLSKVWRSHFMIGGKTRLQQKQQAINLVKKMYGLDVSEDAAEAILIGKYAVDCLRKSNSKKLF